MNFPKRLQPFVWELIKGHYGDRTAARSGVPLINHIREGCVALETIGASTSAINAFAVHPLFQADAALATYRHLLKDFDHRTVFNILEYRRAANAYLCKPHTDAWDLKIIKEQVGHVFEDTRMMLLVDKWQNQKDFFHHHAGMHPRSEQLFRYFQNWLTFLDCQDVLDIIEDDWMKLQSIAK